MIGSLGLGLIGMGVVFMWAGWKGRRVGEFFEQLRPGASPGAVSIDKDPVGGGDFISPAAYKLGPGQAGPVLPPPRMTPR